MALHDELFVGKWFKLPPNVKNEILIFKKAKRGVGRKYAEKLHEKTSKHKRKARG